MQTALGTWEEFFMQKKTLGILLVLCMLLGVLLAMPAAAAEVIEITTAEQILKLMNGDSAFPLDGNYLVKNNIDLSTYSGSLTQKTIGAHPDDSCFTGTFDGGNHTISGFNLTLEQNYSGFFGAAGRGAVIKNVKVSGSITNKANATGGILGYGRDDLTIENCVSNVTVNGNARAAGIIGGYDSMTANRTLIVKDCTNNGAVTAADTQGAGIIGRVVGCADASGFNLVVSNCTNNGTVKAKNQVAGIFANLDLKDSATALIVGCVNNTGVTVAKPASAGANGGGILSTLAISGSNVVMSIENCVNKASVAAFQSGAGILGRVDVKADGTAKLTISNCLNSGEISCKSWLGGIVALVNTDEDSGNTTNLGAIKVLNCTNTGTITIGKANGDAFVGGILGEAMIKDETLLVSACTNTGAVKGNQAKQNAAGGIVGDLCNFKAAADAIVIEDCYNGGTVTSASTVPAGTAGGIVGNLNDYKDTTGVSLIRTCVNNASVSITTGTAGNLVSDDEYADATALATCYHVVAGTTYTGLDSAIWDLTGAAPVLKHAHVFVRSATDATKHVCAHCDMNAVAHDYSYNTTKEMHFCVCGAFGTHAWDTSDADEHVCPTCSLAGDHDWVDADATNHECSVCEKTAAHAYVDYECDACGHAQPIITLTVTALNPWGETVTLTGDTEDGDVTLDFTSIVVEKIGDNWTASNLKLAGADKAHYKLAADTCVFVPADGDVLTVTVTDNAGTFTVEVYKGNSFSTTAASAHAGYEFVGWYDATGTLVTGAETYTTPVYENITLTAKYDKNEENKKQEETNTILAIAVALNSNKKYTISFKSVGAKLYNAQTLRRGQMVVLPEIPVKEGYTFAGWCTDINGTRLYDFSKSVTKSMTLYAKWVKN